MTSKNTCCNRCKDFLVSGSGICASSDCICHLNDSVKGGEKPSDDLVRKATELTLEKYKDTFKELAESDKGENKCRCNCTNCVGDDHEQCRHPDCNPATPKTETWEERFDEKWTKGNYIFYFEFEDKEGKYRWQVSTINDHLPYDDALKLAAKVVESYGNARLKGFYESSFIKGEIKSFISQEREQAYKEGYAAGEATIRKSLIAEKPRLQVGQKLYACLGWDENGKKWDSFRIQEYEVAEGTNRRSLRLKVIEKEGYWYSTGFRYSDIGKRIFMTEEEARNNPLTR